MNATEELKQDIREVLSAANWHMAVALRYPAVCEGDIDQAIKYLQSAKNMLGKHFELEAAA